MQIGEPRPAPFAVSHRLSTSFLWLTMLAIMAAEVLIFVPSIASFRQDWLNQRLETAAVAGVSAEGAGGVPLLDDEAQGKLLRALDAKLVAITTGGMSQLLAKSPDLSAIDHEVSLDETMPLPLILGAFDTLLFGESRMMRVTGPVGDGDMEAEVVMPERKLRHAMLIHSRNLFGLSIVIASFTAIFVYLAISRLLIRPIRGMTRSMMLFREKPTDAERILVPSGRRNEIGLAEAELADMQAVLAETLREQRHLADLGLAVSKINHDLRNILASAQIVSDRLSALPDPHVQRFAPMLIRSLDRALVYTQSVLSYGRAVESRPVRRKVRLRRLVDDVEDVLSLGRDPGIEVLNQVPPDFDVDVDPDQFYRAITNLVRNAIQALESETSEAVIRKITVAAERLPDGGAAVAIEDTGPGLGERAREHLFKAFRGSTRSGGTGLGLAIAAEIVEAHGGRIELKDTGRPGACFEIRLPPPRPAAALPDRRRPPASETGGKAA
ncbi:histidine kinase [Aureimonas sp. Leaf460]|nr:histidine kinase [Aureimonas sp. Leaf427]KQT76286.1 histidine kinase [Aureimonas sp. Leaf460]